MVVADVQAREVSGLSFEERLKIKIESHFEMVRANPRLPFLVMNEFTTNPARIEAFRNKHMADSGPILSQFEDELQKEIQAGRIRETTTLDLIMNVVSLNAMLFMAGNIFKCVGQLSDAQYEMVIEHRKQEHVRVILASLRP
jgi:hypothetical protein